MCTGQCAEGSLRGKAGWCSYQGEVCSGEGAVGLYVNILSDGGGEKWGELLIEASGHTAPG